MNSLLVSPSAAKSLSDTDRVTLARAVFAATFDAAETFRDMNIGSDLAYLMGAILATGTGEDERVDWRAEEYGDVPPTLLEILRAQFPPTSPLWQFVVLD